MSMVSRWLIAIILLVTAVPVQSVCAAGENDYEIPLSDLKKVEKKKPKKEIREKSRPARPAPEYKPAAPTAQQPTNTSSGESADRK